MRNVHHPARALALGLVLLAGACDRRDPPTAPTSGLDVRYSGTFALTAVPSPGAVKAGTAIPLVGEVVSFNAAGDYYGVEYFSEGPVGQFSSNGRLIGSDAIDLTLHGTGGIGRFATTSQDTTFTYVDEWGVWRYERIDVHPRDVP